MVKARYDAEKRPSYIGSELNVNPMIPVQAVLEMALAEPIDR